MPKIEEQIDELVGEDTRAVVQILEALENAVYLTADHVRTNWQDENAAKDWEKCAKAIADCAYFVSEHQPI